MTEQSEADLLEELLAALDDGNMQFKLGKLMGIMSKGDREYIARLEQRLESMTEDRDAFHKMYCDLKEKREQKGKG